MTPFYCEKEKIGKWAMPEKNGKNEPNYVINLLFEIFQTPTQPMKSLDLAIVS
jgi:hypothetical protein